MISLRLRNIDLVLSNHHMNPYSEPTDIASLPVASATHNLHGNEDRNASDGEKSDRSRSRLPSDPGSDVGKDRDDDFPNTSHALGAKGKSPYPPTVLQRCGEFPDNSSIGDFMQFQLHGSGRSIERRYEILYAEASQKVFGKSDGNNASVLAHVEDNAAYVSLAEAVALSKQQSLFFKELDAYNVDASENPAKLHATFNSPMQHLQSGLEDTIRSLGNVIPSHTVVIEAAIYLIQQGIFNIPDVGCVNVKQARALLLVARWLQAHMLRKWHEAGEVNASDVLHTEASVDDHIMILIGPGGTGKTTVLRVVEAHRPLRWL